MIIQLLCKFDLVKFDKEVLPGDFRYLVPGFIAEI
jgi:hypothetical protein